MTNTKLIAAALSAALLAPGFALAQASSPAAPTASDWQYVGGEAGWLYVGSSASARTRSDVQREQAVQPLSRDGWRFVGGETGWLYDGAQYVFDGVQLAHAEYCPFDPAKAAPRPASHRAPTVLFGGA